MHYDASSTKVPALSRTWAAQVAYRECGVVTAIRTHTVTISRAGETYSAEIDGRAATVHAAANVLDGAQLTLIREVIPTPAGIRAHAQAVWA